MKRDNDIIRKLLFDIEADSSSSGKAYFPKNPKVLDALGIGAYEFKHADDLNKEVEYHLQLMDEAGLLRTSNVGGVLYAHLSNSGHDLLDAIRDEEIWKQTKNAASEIGGSITIELVKTLAIGFAKTKISKHTGIDL